MSYLEVPGANIYYESAGEGPMLLCISGGDGSCEIWRGFAQCLKDHFKVVMWDRRGFSRSYLEGSQDYEHRLDGDADDAARLIKHISPNEPATVIGNSSGAIVALRLLVKHSDIIRTLISYEPPAASVLPDFDDLWAFHHKVYNIYRQHGPAPALEEFAKLTKADQRIIRVAFDPKKNPYMWANLQYWFEREFMYYPKADLELESGLRPLKEKLAFVNGEDSPRDAYQFRGNVVLSEKLGLDVNLLPGEHVAHATHAKDFSAKLLELLKARDEFYGKL